MYCTPIPLSQQTGPKSKGEESEGSLKGRKGDSTKGSEDDKKKKKKKLITTSSPDDRRYLKKGKTTEEEEEASPKSRKGEQVMTL